MNVSVRARLSVMMFLEYFIWGAWGVVIFTFMGKLPLAGGLGYPGTLQGWVDATLAIGAMISPIFVGLFADRLFATEKVLAVLHLLGAVFLGWAAVHCTRSLAEIRAAYDVAGRQSVAAGADQPALAMGIASDEDRIQADPRVQDEIRRSAWKLFRIMLLYALCYMPTLTLTNSISFRNLADPDRHFGGIRVLGTIGWIAAGQVVGFALEEVSAQPIWLAAGASAVLAIFCLGLPHTPPAGGGQTFGDTLGLPAWAMLRDRSFVVFVACCLLISVVLKFYYQQGNPFIHALQIPHSAAIMSLGQVSEILFMFLIPMGLRRLGTKGMLLLGMVAWCLRYAVFAWGNVAAVIALGLPLHGICYDFFFVVAYLYVDRRAPPHLRASAQGMITFATLGVGMFLGSLLTGAVYQEYTVNGNTNWAKLWLVPLAGSAAATSLFAALFREPRPPGDVSAMRQAAGLAPSEPPQSRR